MPITPAPDDTPLSPGETPLPPGDARWRRAVWIGVALVLVAAAVAGRFRREDELAVVPAQAESQPDAAPRDDQFLGANAARQGAISARPPAASPAPPDLPDLPDLPEIPPAGTGAALPLAPSSGKPAAATSALAVSAAVLPSTVADTYREAEQLLGRLVERYPNASDCRELKARLLLAMGKSAAAETLWNELLRENPNYSYAYDGLAGVAAKRGDMPQAVQLLEKSASLAPNSTKTLVELARLRMQLGRTDAAADALKKLVALDSRSVEGNMLLGEVLLRKEDYAGARDAYQRAAALAPDYPPAWHGLGTACQRLRLADEAQSHLQRSFQLRARQTQTSNTHVVFSDLRAARREVARIYANAGRIEAALGRGAEAERLWRRASALDPESADARFQLAGFLLSTDRAAEVADVAAELAAMNAEDPAHGLQVAVLFARLGKLDEAEAALAACRKRFPQESGMFRESARFLLQANRKADEALRLANQAVTLDPSAANLALLAEARLRAGDRPGARDALGKAQKLEPANPAHARRLQQIEATP